MSTPANIKIPRGMATRLACSKQHRKAVELLLYMKAFHEDGRFKNTKLQHQQCAKLARISYNTFLTRLKCLSDLKLIRVKDGMLYLASWEDIAEQLQFKLKRKNGKIMFRYIHPPEGKNRIEHILETIAMQEIMDKCEAAFYYFLNKYPEVKETIKRVAGGTLKRSAILISQLENFLLQFHSLDSEERYYLNLFRADNNLNYKYWSEFFKYNSKGGMAYKKRKLESLGYITIERNRTRVLIRHKTTKSRTTYLGNVNFDTRIKRPVLTLPDGITFNSLNQGANV